MCRRTAALLLKIHPKKPAVDEDAEDNDSQAEFTNSKTVLKHDAVLA